jgi:hypothetical protein
MENLDQENQAKKRKQPSSAKRRHQRFKEIVCINNVIVAQCAKDAAVKVNYRIELD